jgi:hypothetical protein
MLEDVPWGQAIYYTLKQSVSCFLVRFTGFFKLKSWETQNFITIKTSWNTND